MCKQAVFSQSEGLEGDGTETHYTYYPATISDGGTGAMVTGVQASDTILSPSAPAGITVPWYTIVGLVLVVFEAVGSSSDSAQGEQ